MALYEDKFCIVEKENLRIKTYYFPMGSEKVVPIDKIKALYYQKQEGLQIITAKSWGQAFTNIWWACDKQRGLTNKYYNVVVQAEDEKINKGFSVTEIEKFLESIKSLLSADVPIVADKLP